MPERGPSCMRGGRLGPAARPRASGLGRGPWGNGERAEVAKLARRFIFNHLVGAGEQRERDGDAERLGDLEVDEQLRPA